MKTNLCCELNGIFTVEHGNKFDLNKMEECEPNNDAIAFVGRSGKENGIVGFVKEFEGVKPFPAGLITVALGGAALSSFVQSRKFYTAQNIDVLTSRTKMSLDAKLFYCLCIEANSFRYSTFGREANRTLKYLLVPKLASIPAWVAGTTSLAVDELSRDLRTAMKSE